MCNDCKQLQCNNDISIGSRNQAHFKDSDTYWCPNLLSDKKFNYEFVGHIQTILIFIASHVAYLDKEKCFACLFYRAIYPFLVPAKDML